MTLIASRLSPAKPGPKAELLDKVVNDLQSEKFAVREKASVQLAKVGESAVPRLRDHLAKTTSAEARRRLVRALELLDPPELSPLRLQVNRALELLESIGSQEAIALLKNLAAGEPNARLTRDAQQSLDRLQAAK